MPPFTAVTSPCGAAATKLATVIFLFLSVSASYIISWSAALAVPPRASLPVISKPTLGIGPVGSTTLIPNLFATIEDLTSVMSPDIENHAPPSPTLITFKVVS